MATEKCIVCGCVNTKKMFHLAASTLMQCSKCYLQFLDPLPTQSTLDTIYENYYSSWDLENSSSVVADMKKNSFRCFLDKLPPSPANRAFLDVGCATGEMLELAESYGYSVYGVEISPLGKRRCKERFGEDKILGKHLEPGDFPEGFFDVITLSDVIEHIPDPVAFLAILHTLLKPHGTLLIITPDTSSWTRKLLGKQWPHYKPEHLYYFNRSNLVRLCANQFELFLAERACKTLSLSYIASVMTGYSRSMTVQVIAKLVRLFPYHWRTALFRVYSGEMLMIFRKIAAQTS